MKRPVGVSPLHPATLRRGPLACAVAAIGLVVGCSAEVDGLDAGVIADSGGGAGDAAPNPDADTTLDADTSGVVTISETSVDFGIVVVGSQASRTLTISNGTNATARVTLAAPSGPAAERFARTISVADVGGVFEVPAGARVTVDVIVSPAAVGTLVGAIAGDLCGGRCPVAITLVAEARQTGVVCDEALEFGVINPGSCARRDARCTNVGNQTEDVPQVMLDPASDPGFTISSLSVHLAFEPGAMLTATVELCADAGDNRGALVVSSTAATQRIALAGRGGGGDIVCQPESIDFGLVAINVTRERELVCQNVGPEPLRISAIGLSSQEFSVDRASVELAPGESVSLRVSVAGSVVGALAADLTLFSDDPDTMELVVPLAAEVVDLQPCTATLVPQTFDFGLIAAGESRSGVVSIVNAGANECVISDVTAPGTTAFSATGPASARIPAGGSAPIAVTFRAPATAGTATAALDVTFVNAGAPLSGLLVGASGRTQLVVTPTALDFGRAPAGCAEPFTRTITVRSVSTTAIVLTGIELGGTSTAAFTLSGVPMNRSLPPFGSFTLTVTFDPATPGVHAAELRISTMSQPAPTIVPITGEGSTGAGRRDETVAGVPLLDLLFVTDDSASMAAAQAALAATAPAIVASLTGRGVDFHIGVVTTDFADPARSGRMLGMPVALDAQTPDLADALAARLAPGTDGDGAAEQGITAAVTAVTPPLSTTNNAGFLRAGAQLAIVILSDENDQGPRADLAAVMAELRGASGNGRAQVSVIVGPATNACNGPHGQAGGAPRYHELAARSDGGLALSYCDPMATSIARVMEQVLGSSAFPLSATPLVSTLTVSVDGAAVPAVDGMGRVEWQYDREANAVRFAAAPAAGARVALAYDQFCLSPTCGDGNTDAREQCDDMNADNGDACVTGCVSARCGDGFARGGAEACDDGNLVETDACLSTCAAARCGDGVVRAGVEDCDDGNTMDGDACPASCDLRLTFAEWYGVSGPVSAPYVSLPSSTAINFMDNDDGSATISLPYSFELFGVATASITVSPNGLISSGALGGAFDNAQFPNPAEPDGAVAVWWEDLLIDPAVTGGAGVSFQVQGTTPNRVTVIEWRGVRLANQSTNNHRRFNAQIALFEGTNVVELRYGETQTSGNPGTATSASVGMENLDGTIGANLLGCTPNCAGPARPQNPNGFPRQSAITITPL